MLKTKPLRIDYYRVINLTPKKDEDGNEYVVEKYFNLSDFLNKLTEIDVVQRNTKNKNGEIIRFQVVKEKECVKITNTDGSKYKYWELEILKERNSSVPGVATKSGEYNPIDIAEGDLLSEDISVLYDPQTYVMAVLRKREGLSPGGIATALTNILSGSDVELRPLVSKQALEQFTDDMIYRSIEVSMINDLSPSEGKSLLGVLDDSNELKAQTINLILSVGKTGSRNQSMSFDAIMTKVKSLVSSPNVTKLKLSAKPSKDKKAETYDMLKEREHDVYYMEFSKENPITHERVFSVIEENYFKKMEKFKVK